MNWRSRSQGLAAALLVSVMVLADAAEKKGIAMLTNAWRGLKPGTATERDIRAAFGAPDRQAASATYGSVTGLHMMTYEDLTATFFLHDERLLLIVLVPRAGDEFPTHLAAWQSKLGQAAHVLPSSGDKNQRVQVYSQTGLTATTDGPLVVRVEVFPPISPEDYQRTLYKVPPVFRK
jgi:hypothetical protein